MPQDSNNGRDNIRQLIIAFTGPYRAGVSTAANLLKELLSNGGIDSCIIKISRLLEAELESLPQDERKTQVLQEAGDKKRKENKHAIAIMVLEELRKHREELFSQKDPEEFSNNLFVYIIDSVKNPFDILPLKEIYEDSVHLVSILSDRSTRKKRMAEKSRKDISTLFSKIDETDYGDDDKPYAQNVRKCVELSDYFIMNSNISRQQLKDKLNRMMKTLLLHPFVGPTKEEYAMYIAWATSLRSMCLSRQVGASIMNSAGELISTGYNDPPRYEGGVYDPSMENHACCFNWSDGNCMSDENKDMIIASLAGDFSERFDIPSKDSREILQRNREIRSLLEFSRSIHAEMAAIINISRSTASIDNASSLFVTTYPCHHCARHIVCAGIKTVYYIEAYPKSRASQLHHDCINDDTMADANQNKVNFLHYEGVAPKQYTRVFHLSIDRKDSKITPNSELPQLSEAVGFQLTIGDYDDGTKVQRELLDEKEVLFLKRFDLRVKRT